MNTERYFDLAKNASTFSDYNKVHIGCVIVYKKQVIGIGWNTKKTNPIQKYYNQFRTTEDDIREYDINSHTNSLHAEMMAILNATRTFKGDLSKCSIFVYRELKNGNLGIAKPCKACSQMLQDFGIKNIYYTTENGYVYERREYEINN